MMIHYSIQLCPIVTIRQRLVYTFVSSVYDDYSLHSRYIPAGFKMSYIAPIPKLKDARSKALTCNDFRGIAITPVISKLFEYCFLDRFQSVFATESNQFGFYPRDAMLAQVIAIATCLSVRLSVRHAPVLCQNEES